MHGHHPLLDLSPEDRAAKLMEAGLQASQSAEMRAVAAPFLERLDPEARLFGEFMVEELARLSAQVAAMAQIQQADAMSRAERLRIDPLRFIPLERQAQAAAPLAAPETGPYSVDVAAEDFIGFGWYPAEQSEEGPLRWSGLSRCATLQVPALGGGKLAVTLALRAPFGAALDLAQQDVFLDGLKLDLDLLSEDGAVKICRGTAVLPAMPGGSRLALLVAGERLPDPDSGPRRDSRVLGLGLGWVRVERAA